MLKSENINKLTFLSSSHDVSLWYDNTTFIKTTEKGVYVYNIYSSCLYLSRLAVKHKKLKIYHNDRHGYYVIASGIRCYCNSFVKEKNR